MTPDLEAPLSQAQMLTADNRLDRRINGDVWLSWSAKAEPDGDSAVTWDSNQESEHRGRGVLDALVALRDSNAKRVAKFVTRYGPLPLCEHGRVDRHGGCSGSRGDTQPPHRVEWYSSFGRDLYHVLRLAAAAHLERSADALSVRFLATRDPLIARIAAKLRPGVSQTRRIVAESIRWWLQRAGSLEFEWRGAVPRVEWIVDNPLAAAGRQLVLVISRIDALAWCAECGTPFIPTSRRVASRRAFCSDCGKRAAWRQATRDARARRGKLKG